MELRSHRAAKKTMVVHTLLIQIDSLGVSRTLSVLVRQKRRQIRHYVEKRRWIARQLGTMPRMITDIGSGSVLPETAC